MKRTISILYIVILFLCFSIGSVAQKKKAKTSEYKAMVRIPAGAFQMGDHFGEGQKDELPVHTVYISEFWMDKYEVTNEEYKKCVDAGRCSPPGYSSSVNRGPYYGISVYNDYPVIYVDWNQAKSYCEWKGGRLPTEAEWEYAARGGLSGRRHPNGDSISCNHANSYGCVGDTYRVGKRAANRYGLYDMAGNVWEWINDWYDANYYSNSPSKDPRGLSSGKYRVSRGGSWGDVMQDVGAAFRNGDDPAGVYGNVGFRCVR